MEIAAWWSRVDADTRAWLIAHNGEPLTAEVREQIARVGGSPSSHLTDGDVDWVEAVANGE